MAITLLQALQDRKFLFGAGRQGGVAAFTGNRQPLPAVGQQPRDPQARAGSQQRQWGVGLTGPHSADGAKGLGRQVRQGQGQRSEIVEHPQGLQAQRLLQLADRKGPVVVGHANQVARHRIGNADAGRLWPWQSACLQVGVDGCVNRGMGRAGHYTDVTDGAARRCLPAEAGIGATHVTKQTGKRGSGGEGQHGVSGSKNGPNPCGWGCKFP